MRHITLSCLIFSLVGCSTVNEVVTPSNIKDNSTNTAYHTALADAAVIEAHEVIDLPILNDEKTSVITWTNYTDSYPVGEEVTLAWGDVWVTLDGDVKARCQTFEQNTLNDDIQKLLGLPLKPAERYFITLEVNTADLFRPCANPDISNATRCGLNFPDEATIEHRAWYAGQTATAYHAPMGYPWTRLGYTYNWKEGASEVGVPEFVIKKTATVKVIDKTATQAYCQK